MEDKVVKKDALIFIKDDRDLVELIKVSREKNLEVGKDLYVISYDDSFTKEVLAGGISCYTPDYHKMANNDFGHCIIGAYSEFAL